MSARIVCGDVLTQVSKCTQMFADFISRAADARQASSALSHLHTTATVITNITNLPKPPLSLTKVTYTCTHPRLFVCLSALLNYVKETFKTSPSQWRRTKFTQYHTKMPKTPSVSLAGACRNLFGGQNRLCQLCRQIKFETQTLNPQSPIEKFSCK